MLPFFKLYVTFYSNLLHLPRNYTIETVYFVQLAVFCKAGLLQFRVRLSRLRSRSRNENENCAKFNFIAGALM